MFPDIFRSLYFSIRAFGLLKGLRLPVYVYSPVKIYHMGSIVLRCPLKRHMISIGLNEANVPFSHTNWDNRGTIEVYGKVAINYGCRISNSGTIVFGGGNALGYACSLDIHDRLEVGHDTSLGSWSDIMDWDSHFMVDVASRQILRNSKTVRIGSFNWFGSHTFVKKGTVTPDYMIVASPNALLCGDYSSIEPYTIMGGAPAKPIAVGKRRVYNFRNERMLQEFFSSSGKETYALPDDVNLDMFCKYDQ